MEKKRTPRLRFRGFTDDWEQRKLLGCIEKITDFRGRTPKKLGMDWSENGYLALSALNVKDGYIDFSRDVHYGDQDLYDKWMSGNELHKGQVLFTTEAPMGNVAQVPDTSKYILSQRTIAFDVKAELITEDFLATVLRTPKVFSDLTSLSTGGTAKGVSQKTLAFVNILIPRDLAEQDRLSSFFKSLDGLITLHQRKLESIKLLKKSLLQKMFPKSGETVPEVRFPGFTDAWEQRKLDKIANRYDNLRIPVTASDRISGTTPYYGANGIQDYVKGFTHDGEFVLIAEDGANDLHNYPVQYVNGKVWVNNHAHVLQGINGLVDTRFLGYAFSQVNMEAILVGGSRAKLNASDLMKIEIRLPRLMQEQQHIATFLHSLDQTITLHQRKVEALQKLKKSLLQQMFV